MVTFHSSSYAAAGRRGCGVPPIHRLHGRGAKGRLPQAGPGCLPAPLAPPLQVLISNGSALSNGSLSLNCLDLPRIAFPAPPAPPLQVQMSTSLLQHLIMWILNFSEYLASSHGIYTWQSTTSQLFFRSLAEGRGHTKHSSCETWLT